MKDTALILKCKQGGVLWSYSLTEFESTGTGTDGTCTGTDNTGIRSVGTGTGTEGTDSTSTDTYDIGTILFIYIYVITCSLMDSVVILAI